MPAAPTVEDIEAIVDAAFWASLRREEGYMPRISLALLPPEQRRAARCCSTRRCRFAPAALVKVAPAVERAGHSPRRLARSGDGLRVWGTTRTIPPLLPGARGRRAGPARHQASPRRRAASSSTSPCSKATRSRCRRTASSAARLPALLTSLLGFDAPAGVGTASSTCWCSSRCRCARTGAAASLLVVPAGSDAWRESIVQPIPYAVNPPFGGLGRPGARAPTTSTDAASGRTRSTTRSTRSPG